MHKKIIMKYLYLLGFIIWGVLSYFSLFVVENTVHWYSGLSVVFKIIILFVSSLVIIMGLHKIILSFALFNNTKDPNFNLISGLYSIIGLVVLIISYFLNKIDLLISEESSFNSILTTAFSLSLLWILISGFILFPKSVKIR